jgi:hypothetical protein
MATAALASVIAISVHDLGDFSLDATGGVGFTTAVLFGMALPATSGLAVNRKLWRIAPVVGAAALAGWAGVQGFRGDLGRDVARVREAQLHNDPVQPLADAAMLRHPVEPWFPYAAGVDLVKRHEPVTAVHYLNRALELDHTAWKPHQAIGEAMWQVGRKEQAILEYRIAYVGSNYTTSVVLGLMAHRGVHYGTGLEKLAGDDADLLAHLAFSLASTYKDADARLVARHLLELRPIDETTQRLYAHSSLRLAPYEKDPAARRRLYEEALTAARALPARDPDTTLLAVHALDGLDRSDEADALLEADFGVHPANLTAFLLAERQLGHQHADDALASLAKVHLDGLEPEQLGRYHLLRARALEQKGKARDAVLEYTEASRIHPVEANRLELAAAFERAGLLREALLNYRSILRSSPSPSAGLKEHLEKLEEEMGLRPSTARTAAKPGGVSPGVGLGSDDDDKEKSHGAVELPPGAASATEAAGAGEGEGEGEE